MAGSLKWNGPEAQRRIRALMVVRLRAAADLVRNRAEELLSVEGTAVGTGRDKKGRFRKRLVYGANPSAPGEPPHTQTGRLKGSVSIEIDEATMTARIGTNLKHGRWLELGTRFIKARPWLRRALLECRSAIRAVFARGKGV